MGLSCGLHPLSDFAQISATLIGWWQSGKAIFYEEMFVFLTKIKQTNKKTLKNTTMAETRLLDPIREPWPIFDLPPGVKRKPGVGVFGDSSLEKIPGYFPHLLVSGSAIYHPQHKRLLSPRILLFDHSAFDSLWSLLKNHDGHIHPLAINRDIWLLAFHLRIKKAIFFF